MYKKIFFLFIFLKNNSYGQMSMGNNELTGNNPVEKLSTDTNINIPTGTSVNINQTNQSITYKTIVEKSSSNKIYIYGILVVIALIFVFIEPIVSAVILLGGLLYFLIEESNKAMEARIQKLKAEIEQEDFTNKVDKIIKNTHITQEIIKSAFKLLSTINFYESQVNSHPHDKVSNLKRQLKDHKTQLINWCNDSNNESLNQFFFEAFLDYIYKNFIDINDKLDREFPQRSMRNSSMDVNPYQIFEKKISILLETMVHKIDEDKSVMRLERSDLVEKSSYYSNLQNNLPGLLTEINSLVTNMGLFNSMIGKMNKSQMKILWDIIQYIKLINQEINSILRDIQTILDSIRYLNQQKAKEAKAKAEQEKNAEKNNTSPNNNGNNSSNNDGNYSSNNYSNNRRDDKWK